MLIWHNGDFVEAHAVFMADDRVRLGDGVFDTMLAVNGKPVFASEHFERLHDSATILGITCRSAHELIPIASDLLRRNGFVTGHYAINTLVTRGPAARGIQTPDTQIPTVIMRASPVPESFLPLRAIVAHSVKRNEGSPLSRMKSCNYGDNILAMREAEARGAFEAVMLNNAGNVACFTTGNLYIAEGKILLTPPLQDGAMDGIIRRKLLAAGHAREAKISLEMLRASDRIYISNSLRGITPLSALDDRACNPASLEMHKNFHLG